MLIQAKQVSGLCTEVRDPEYPNTLKISLCLSLVLRPSQGSSYHPSSLRDSRCVHGWFPRGRWHHPWISVGSQVLSVPLALLFSTRAALCCPTTWALLVLEWLHGHTVCLQEQALAVAPTGHPLNHPVGTRRQERKGQTPLQGDTAPNNPNRPSQIQRRSISQAAAKGENDNWLIEISERPANAITKTLLKTPPQAPTAIITDYWRSHGVGAKSLCPAGPENWENISPPNTRSDIPLAAGMMSKSCLGASPAPQPARATTLQSPQQHNPAPTTAPASRAPRAATLPARRSAAFAS